IFNWASPPEKRFRQNDRLEALACKKAFKYALHFAGDEYYKEMLSNYAARCFHELGEERLPSGAFSTKQLVTSGAPYYFMLLGLMSSHSVGLETLNTIGIFQRGSS
ncbi:unnamed protein product, partial [Mesorhabditis spiculigera]